MWTLFLIFLDLFIIYVGVDGLIKKRYFTGIALTLVGVVLLGWDLTDLMRQ